MQSRPVYGALDRAWRTVDALGNFSETTYDARSLAIRNVDLMDDSGQELVDTISHTVHDAQGRAVLADDPHRPGRNAAGTAIAYTNPAQPGQSTDGTRTIYDRLGRVVETQRRRDVVLTVGTDPGNGAPEAQVVSEGTLLSKTVSQYDDAGRVPRSIRTTYAADGATVVDAVATETDFDDAGMATEGRVIVGYGTATPVLASTTINEYDAAGRPALTTDPLGHWTRTHYDDLGRPFKTTYNDLTTTLTAYDRRGNRIAQTDQAGITTDYEFDPFGNLTAVVLPPVRDGEATPSTFGSYPLARPRYEYQYDPHGNLALIRDAKGRETTFTYDEQGRRTSRTLPLGQLAENAGRFVETWTYDDLGRTDRHVDFKGQVTDYDYDGRGRLATKSFYADIAATAPIDTVTYAYDDYTPEGRRETTTDTRNPSTDQRLYDRAGRLTRLDTPQGTIRYEHDPSTGQKVRMATGGPRDADD